MSSFEETLYHARLANAERAFQQEASLASLLTPAERADVESEIVPLLRAGDYDGVQVRLQLYQYIANSSRASLKVCAAEAFCSTRDDDPASPSIKDEEETATATSMAMDFLRRNEGSHAYGVLLTAASPGYFPLANLLTSKLGAKGHPLLHLPDAQAEYVAGFRHLAKSEVQKLWINIEASESAGTSLLGELLLERSWQVADEATGRLASPDLDAAVRALEAKGLTNDQSLWVRIAERSVSPAEGDTEAARGNKVRLALKRMKAFPAKLRIQEGETRTTLAKLLLCVLLLDEAYATDEQPWYVEAEHRALNRMAKTA